MTSPCQRVPVPFVLGSVVWNARPTSPPADAFPRPALPPCDTVGTPILVCDIFFLPSFPKIWSKPAHSQATISHRCKHAPFRGVLTPWRKPGLLQLTPAYSRVFLSPSEWPFFIAVSYHHFDNFTHISIHLFPYDPDLLAPDQLIDNPPCRIIRQAKDIMHGVAILRSRAFGSETDAPHVAAMRGKPVEDVLLVTRRHRCRRKH